MVKYAVLIFSEFINDLAPFYYPNTKKCEVFLFIGLIFLMIFFFFGGDHRVHNLSHDCENELKLEKSLNLF